ncbi:DUF2490 domain-containing protein [Confluentibacter flavum]|uniref:DUF2490 domain-containing protein n=1 Tax=Confluentibacter flavum TaxID=1909700 RepID=A0A2N3HIP6_9FLAO|nr:DUF2490 domain-containing protein [Confluentibacter flavum]PKQ44698.1 hypothetical protein CSW08_11990 [Confluentibacter flavum]
MNTRIIALIFVLVLPQIKNSVFAQSAYQFGGLPSFNLNSKLKNDWSLNTKIEFRQLFQSGELNGDVDKSYKYALTDFSLIAAKNVGLNSRIASGYLIRFEDGELFHRFIQQYVIVQRLSGFRLAHRFLSDQTFSKIEKPKIRIRYRITSEIPLNGESVNPEEFYVKINNEYVNSLQAMEYDLEIRLVPLLGFSIAGDFKIETGLDYRVDSFLNNKTRHSYWMTLNFFIEI